MQTPFQIYIHFNTNYIAKQIICGIYPLNLKKRYILADKAERFGQYKYGFCLERVMGIAPPRCACYHAASTAFIRHRRRRSRVRFLHFISKKIPERTGDFFWSG